jgi:hypothetical protein
MQQSINISDTEIYIEAQFFVHKDFSVSGKELLLDIFSKHYTNQAIRIYVHDGENIEFSGFVDFVRYLCDVFAIPESSIKWETHGTVAGFANRKLVPGIFVSVNRFIPQQFDKNVDNAKFIGAALGRFNPTRLRLAYELDNAFPNDNFMIYQTRLPEVGHVLRHTTDVYKDELAWLNTKQFDKDLISNHQNGMIDWQTSCANYPNIWTKYQIEVISETDSMSDFWFTEKTARCLATGKPFVLIAGQGSLKRLQDMGFATFNHILDEGYDNEPTPTKRIMRLIDGLKVLYNKPTRHKHLQLMYQIAEQNIAIYKDYISRQKEE